eukprot:5013485-Amphidinium_carterae.1
MAQVIRGVVKPLQHGAARLSWTFQAARSSGLLRVDASILDREAQNHHWLDALAPRELREKHELGNYSMQQFIIEM